jgi:hypothetical protein
VPRRKPEPDKRPTGPTRAQKERRERREERLARRAQLYEGGRLLSSRERIALAQARADLRSELASGGEQENRADLEMKLANVERELANDEATR